jgi:hypothetical protein
MSIISISFGLYKHLGSFSSAWKKTIQKKAPVSRLRQAFGGQARLWYGFNRSAGPRRSFDGRAGRRACTALIADARRGTKGATTEIPHGVFDGSSNFLSSTVLSVEEKP